MEGLPILVLNAYLSPNNQAHRLEASEAAANSFSTPKRWLVLIGGSLNAAPGAQEIDNLQTGLTDSYLAAGSPPGCDAVGRREYVFVDGANFKTKEYEAICSGPPAYPIALSDHPLIKVTFQLPDWPTQ
jgi:hypothetical protein